MSEKQPFDFYRWREWLKAATEELQKGGFTAACKANDQNVRTTAVELSAAGRLASFCNWESGFVDYEILETVPNRLVANEAMIVVHDQNFAAVFQQFADKFSKPN